MVIHHEVQVELVHHHLFVHRAEIQAGAIN
jgi:hypothetical protein